MNAVVSTATPHRSGILNILRGPPILGPLAALLLASIFFATQTDRFLSGANFSLIFQQVMVVGTLAIGQTLVILTGGIDLSNGMIMALSSVLMTGLFANSGMNPFLAVLVGLAVCAGLRLAERLAHHRHRPAAVHRDPGHLQHRLRPGPHLHHRHGHQRGARAPLLRQHLQRRQAPRSPTARW